MCLSGVVSYPSLCFRQNLGNFPHSQTILRLCSTVPCDNPIYWPYSRIIWRLFVSNSATAAYACTLGRRGQATPVCHAFTYLAARVRKSRYWGETLQVPHPLLWRNEASLLVQWRTMYFPLALWTLFVFIVCCRLTGQCFSVLRTSIRRHTDVVDSSSGRSYVTEQWHNVPLLRTRALLKALTHFAILLYSSAASSRASTKP